MAKIVNISGKATSVLEQLALAHSMLDKGNAENCLVYLNDCGCKGADAEMLRGRAFAELRNGAMSNLAYFKAVKHYLVNGGKIRDAYLEPAIRGIVSNCYDLKKYEAANYYLSLSRRKREAAPSDFSSLEKMFADMSVSEKAGMASEDDVGDDAPDFSLLDDFADVKKSISKKKYDKAIAQLRKMLQKCPSEYRVTILLMIAKCEYDRCEYRACMDACREVFALVPAHTRARCIYCRSAFKDGDADEAESVATALSGDGGIEDNDDIYDIAELFVELKFYPHLLAYAERLLELDDEDYLFVKIYALALHLNGRRDEARKLIARQAAMFGDGDDARFVMRYFKSYPDCEIYPELESFYPDEMDRDMNAALEECKRAADATYDNFDADAFAEVLDRYALELDYIARYGSSADDGNWQYLTVAEAIALNADELPPRFVAKLEDRLLDEDLSPEMRELTLHALTLQQSRMFAYYVVNGRLYRMDVRMPGELLDLPEKFEPLLDAYGIIKVKSAIRGRNEPRKLDDAARYLVKAIKKYKIMDKISEPVVLVKMFKFFVEHYDFDNGEELAKACCAVDKIDAEVDIDDLYY